MQFGIFDPRSIAMGGTGVASGTSDNATYFNPALLSAANRKQDRLAVNLIAAARVSDPHNVEDDFKNLSDSGDALTSALSRFNGSPTAANSGSLAKALGDFNTSLQAVNNKPAEANIFASPVTVGVPGKDLGWGFYASARADASANSFVGPGDSQTLATYQALAQNYANTNDPAALQALRNFGDKNGDGQLDDPQLQSRIAVLGIAIAEFGISLSHEFQVAHDNISVGITPKYQRISTFAFTVDTQHQDIPDDKGRKDYRSSNLDIGLVKELGTGFKFGLVGKNVIARSFTTVVGRSIELKPQVRAGLAHQTSASTVAIDVDVTENDAVGFDKPTRYLGIGGEFRAWDAVRLRVGYRKDLAGNYDGVVTFGFGFTVFGVQLDAGVAGRYPKDATAALQLGYGF